MPEQGSGRHIEYIKADRVDALAKEPMDRLWGAEGEAIMDRVLNDKGAEVRRIPAELKQELVYYGMLSGLILVLEGMQNGNICVLVTDRSKGTEING